MVAAESDFTDLKFPEHLCGALQQLAQSLRARLAGIRTSEPFRRGPYRLEVRYGSCPEARLRRRLLLAVPTTAMALSPLRGTP